MQKGELQRDGELREETCPARSGSRWRNGRMETGTMTEGSSENVIIIDELIQDEQ